MSVSMISACKQGAVGTAEKMLKEKYGEDFVVERIGNSSFSKKGAVHSAFCHPEKNENILFELWINDDGTTFIDKYKEALIGHEMKMEAEEILSSITSDYAMATDVMSIVDGYAEGTRISEYDEDITCYVLLAINIDDNSADLSPSKLYKTIEDMYKNWRNIKGSLFLYLVDSDGMSEIKECMEKNPRMDSTLFEKCGDGFISDADNSGIKKSQSEMEQALY